MVRRLCIWAALLATLLPSVATACPGQKLCRLAMVSATQPFRAPIAAAAIEESPTRPPARPVRFFSAAREIGHRLASGPSSVPLVNDDDEARERLRSKRMPPMPWIWQQVKTYAYARLPRHRGKRFEAVWAPVIVETAGETTPGLGLEGLF